MAGGVPSTIKMILGSQIIKPISVVYLYNTNDGKPLVLNMQQMNKW